MKILKTERGVRIVQGDAVLSEVLDEPGPTHSVFDVLAAAVAELAQGPAVALLGFAGGGIVAPLRAMGWDGALDAVDLDPTGEQVFREISSRWCGEVRFHRAEATDWLRRSDRRFDLVVDDLSVPLRGEITKPRVSVEVLPERIRRRLRPGGAAVANALPVPGLSWSALQDRLRGAAVDARVILFDEFENRVVLASAELPDAADLSRRLRRRLRAIDSSIAGAISVRTQRGTP